jgi:hypothetical protein
MDLNRLRILAGLDPILESAEPPVDDDSDEGEEDEEEEELGDLQESAPADEEEFVKKAKPDFKKRYGKRWKEVLYATAWKKHKKEANENIEVTADEIFAKLEEAADADMDSEFKKVHQELSDIWPSISDKSRLFLKNEFERLAALNKKGYPNTHDKVPVLNGLYQLSDDIAAISSGRMTESIADAKKLADQPEGDNPAKTGNHDSEFPKIKFLGDKGPANELTLTTVEFNDDKMEYNKVMTGADVEEKAKVKVPANVKAAITKRLKELKDSIETYNEKGYSDEGAIYQDPKHTAVDVLEKIQAHLNKGNVEEFKMAQVLYGTLDSPIFDLLPSQLVNFLHTGHEEKKKEI